MNVSHSNWFLAVPVILVILLNMFILARVILILRSKLTTDQSSQATKTQAEEEED